MASLEGCRPRRKRSPVLAPRLRRDAAQLGGHLRFVAGGSAVEPGSPMIVRQSRATIERACLVAQMRVTIGLIEQGNPLSLPFFRIDRFAAAKIRQGIDVFAELPINPAATAKCRLRRSELDDLVHISECPPRLAQIAPYEMPGDIWAEVFGILLKPFIDNLEEAPGIGAAELMELPYFLG